LTRSPITPEGATAALILLAAAALYSAHTDHRLARLAECADDRLAAEGNLDPTADERRQAFAACEVQP
jgi:hypothetical protein